MPDWGLVLVHMVLLDYYLLVVVDFAVDFDFVD